jgi:hypothetical protein
MLQNALDFSEEHIASIFRVQSYTKQESCMKQAANREGAGGRRQDNTE